MRYNLANIGLFTKYFISYGTIAFMNMPLTVLKKKVNSCSK